MQRAGIKKKTHEFDGCDLVMLGYTAGQETCRILTQNYEKLKKLFPAFWLEGAKDPLHYEIREIPEAAQSAAAFWFPVGDRGLFEALWLLGEEYRVGMEIDFRRIPIRQETIELCEWAKKDPYEEPCGRVYLAAAENGLAFQELCRENGISAAVIGRLNGKEARTLKKGDEIRYLNRAARDQA